MTWRTWVSIGSLMAGIGVALGALAAHGLEKRLSERELDNFKTGVRYQMYHSLALVSTGLVMARRDSKGLQAAAWAFLLGTVMFSGSLYVIALAKTTWMGAIITPIGGVTFLVGWTLLSIAVCRGPE